MSASAANIGRRQRDDALQQGARKKPQVLTFDSCKHALTVVSSHVPDPLVHRGRHFGRVTYAFCNVSVLISNGLLRMGDRDGSLPETSK
jgi:hypothetical protein